MDFGEVVDCGDAASYFVRRIGRVELVGSLIRIGWVDFNRSFTKPRLVVSTMMDLQELLAAREAFPDMLTRATKEATQVCAQPTGCLRSTLRH